MITGTLSASSTKTKRSVQLVDWMAEPMTSHLDVGGRVRVPWSTEHSSSL
jgi:hypothetical protein